MWEHLVILLLPLLLPFTCLSLPAVIFDISGGAQQAQFEELTTHECSVWDPHFEMSQTLTGISG